MFSFLSGLTSSARGSELHQIVVKFKPGSAEIVSGGEFSVNGAPVLNRISSMHSIKKIDRLFKHQQTTGIPQSDDYYLLKTDSSTDIEDLLGPLNSDEAVEWAEPNYRYKIHYVPNDSLYGRQWAMKKIGMEQAWNIERGSAQVIVGVIDTGIDYEHPDLRNQLWINSGEDLNHNGRLDAGDLNNIDDDGNGYTDDIIGWDFTDAPDFPDAGDYLEPDNDPMDEYPGGHGTAVAGLIAAEADNFSGISGVAPAVKVMALRAGTASGYLEEDDIAEAVVYAIRNGCRIINMSFGDIVYSHLIKDAVDFGTKKGVLFVVSAGNSGNDVLQYPAAYDETISVGATEQTDNLASFSSYGSKIDLVAPGQDILSPVPGNQFGEMNGTSFSAPLVSGALGLLWSHDLQADARRIKSQLLAGCTDLGVAGWDKYFGQGLLNVENSLTSELGGAATLISPSTQSGICSASEPIIGTATAPDMDHYVLSYGTGEAPDKMIPFHESTDHIVADTLGWWNLSGLPDTVYTLELKLVNKDLSDIVQRAIVYLDRSAPALDSLKVIPMIFDNHSGYLLELKTDDKTIATLHYRPLGTSAGWQSRTSGYFNNEHTFLLSRKEISGDIEYYFKLINPSGLTTEADNSHAFYQLDLAQDNTFTEDFQKMTEEQGTGYFYPKTVDINGDGIREIIANANWPDLPEPRISLITYVDGTLERQVGPIPAFPRDVLDTDGDSLPEILAGYGGISYLFPGRSLPGFSSPPVQCPVNDFWGSRMYYTGLDHAVNILALHQNKWHIYRLDNPETFSVTDLQTLENPTTGDNNYGIPFAEMADLDGDQKREIITGDYDGDLIVYEGNASGRFDPVFQKRLPGVDATSGFALGDFDGDHLQELAIATRIRADYAAESAVDQQYWNLSILKSDGDNSLQTVWQQNFHGVSDQKNIYSGLTAADYDGDGADELFFTPYPKAYFINYQDAHYQVSWYYRGVNCNAVPLLDGNHFILAGGASFAVWQKTEAGKRPLPPAALQIQEADTGHILLYWQTVSGADSYLISRTQKDAGSIREFQTSHTTFCDTMVSSNVLYLYFVRTIDMSFPDSLSAPGNEIEVSASNPPAFEGLTVEDAHQIMLHFSEPLGDQSFQNDLYLLLPDSIRPISAIRGKGKEQILLGFLNAFPPGNHQLVFANLRNQYGVPFCRDTLRINFDQPVTPETPYLKKVEFISKRRLLLRFNHFMDRKSIENFNNYRLIPEGRVIKASLDSLDGSIVHLYLAGKNRMGSLGIKYYLEISGLKDAYGQSIPSNWANRYLIEGEVESLADIVVYPNPFRVSEGKNEIMFGNLPDGCEIFIYTVNGQQVARLEDQVRNGGIRWDLKNGVNEQVSSGVYIFLAKYRDQKKLGKFVVLR